MTRPLLQSPRDARTPSAARGLIPVVILAGLFLLASVPVGGAAASRGTATSSSITTRGTLTRAETLRREPYTDARRVTSLRTGVAVAVQERRGGWYRVTSGRNAGWVRMLAVRLAAPTPARSAGGVATGRHGSGSVVSTTGIRALDAGDLKAATFNETEAARLSHLAVTETEARRHAAAQGLVARPIPYLPAPPAARTGRR